MSRTHTPPPELCYRPATPWHHRLPARGLVWCAVVVAACLSGFTWASHAWHKGQLIYWQSRCMSFVSGANFPPQAGLFTAGSGAVPVEWGRFHELVRGSQPNSLGTVYLHERVAPCGSRRLVVVDVQQLAGCFDMMPVAIARVIVPGGPFTRPRERTAGDSMYLLEGAVRVLWGTSDPSDASHFTFAYRVEGNAEVVVDGWLRDDDTVKLERRTAG